MSVASIKAQLEEEIAKLHAEVAALEKALATLGGETTKRRGRPPGTAQKNGRVPRGTAVDSVLDAVREHPDSKPAVLAEAAGIPARSVYATTNRLLKEGRLARGPEGGYVIPDETAEVEVPDKEPAEPQTEDAPAETGGADLLKLPN